MMKETCGKAKTFWQKAAVLVLSLLVGLTAVTPMLSAKTEKVSAAASSNQINYFGTVVPCGKDNGYLPNTSSAWNPWTLLTIPGIVMGLIPDDDPHKGWELGSFFVQGYSGRVQSTLNAYGQDMPVYLKNAGDTLSFGFKLDQDIDALNGNDEYIISDDHEIIQDCWVDDPYVAGDLGRGVLIVVHTDWQGKETKTVYKDFLESKRVGSNTQIQLFEEGDYRVVLCYEIYKDDFWNWATDWMDPNGSWFNYRMESYFSVRNGNAMVYPYETETGTELTNTAYTEKGFRLSLAKSRYLQLSVKKENLNQSGTEIVEDVRFNGVVADGSVFKNEGKYTITVKNVYTDLTTEKVIYVGTNDVMRCNAVTGMDVPTINERLRVGYRIQADGTLAEPLPVQEEPSGEIEEEVVVEAPAEMPPAPAETETDSNEQAWKITAISAMGVLVIVGVVALIKRMCY